MQTVFIIVGVAIGVAVLRRVVNRFWPPARPSKLH